MPRPITDPATLGLAEAASRIAARALSPVELVDAVLDRTARLNDRLKAYTEVFAEGARHAARAREAELRSGLPVGPLHGVPVAVKDLLAIEGYVTTSGSRAHAGRVADDTATVVRRLLGAGAVVIGKAHLVEFAFGGWGTNQGMGTPWNPWDAETHRAPGGSSSGSAVAVAGGMALGALGTDTGGSVRIPSAFCGLTGLKVTEGRVSNAGLSYVSRTLDTIGPMAWSAEDVALLLQVIHGPDPRHPRSLAVPPADFLAPLGQPVTGTRIGVPQPHSLGSLEADVAAAFQGALALLESIGCHVGEIDRALDFAAEQEETGIIIASEAFAESGEAAASDTPGDAAARARVLRGKDIPAPRYAAAMAARAARQREFLRLFDGVDVLALPTLPIAAPPVSAIDEADLSPSRLTRFASYFGLCAIALPCGFSAAGLPLSLQLVAAPYREDLLIRLGAAFQKRTDWHRRRPDLAKLLRN